MSTFILPLLRCRKPLITCHLFQFLKFFIHFLCFCRGTKGFWPKGILKFPLFRKNHQTLLLFCHNTVRRLLKTLKLESTFRTTMKQYLWNLLARSGLIDTRWLLVWTSLTSKSFSQLWFLSPRVMEVPLHPMRQIPNPGLWLRFCTSAICSVFPSVLLKQKWYQGCAMKGRGKRCEKDLQVSRQKSAALSSTSK